MRSSFAALAAVLGAVLPAAAQQKGPFEVKSGILETESDMFGKQTQVLYFDDFGNKQATWSTSAVEMGGIKSVTHKLEIRLPDGTSYNVDLDAKTGSKMKIDPEVAKALAAGMAGQMQKELEVTTKDLPAKEFLGKKCKGLEVTAMGIPTRTWTWKGLPLYTEAALGQGKPVITRATKLQVDVPVPAEKFKVPAGVQIQEMTND